ncbi:homoserine kinase [Inediibacterium massiliense]|uniref:homoserine kinase n=1 Tax=Inediibacterium massiliense TaxID=1658111 RepID=UPI0006B40B2B|nr:homoserine kinase [Inediibacterium massiliense]
MFKVRVPATTANMGPGFDTLGMALSLYNEWKVEKVEKGFTMVDCDLSLEDNLVYQSMKKVLDEHKTKIDGIKITPSIQIPMSRGLGSSATAIVGGIMIANILLGNVLTKDDMIHIGTKMEGHPDNIVPAVLGGMYASIYENGEVIYSKVNVPKNLRFVVMSPDFFVSTHEARKVLPHSYSKENCIFNLSRVAMLICAMNNGEIDKLRISMEDKIHQPYRAPLIKDIKEIFDHSKLLGSKAEVISGSGSTLLAIVEEDNTTFQEKMNEYLEKLENNWDLKMLKMDEMGVQIG